MIVYRHTRCWPVQTIYFMSLFSPLASPLYEGTKIMSFVACRDLRQSVVTPLSPHCHSATASLLWWHCVTLDCFTLKYSMSSRKGWIDRMWFSGALSRRGIYSDQISIKPGSWNGLCLTEDLLFLFSRRYSIRFLQRRSPRNWKGRQHLFDKQFSSCCLIFQVLWKFLWYPLSRWVTLGIHHSGRYLHWFSIDTRGPNRPQRVEENVIVLASDFSELGCV